MAQVLRLSPLIPLQRAAAEKHPRRRRKRPRAAEGHAGNAGVDSSHAGDPPGERSPPPVASRPPVVPGAATTMSGSVIEPDSSSVTELDSEEEEDRSAAEAAAAALARDAAAAAREVDRLEKQRKLVAKSGSREARNLQIAFLGDKCAPCLGRGIHKKHWAAPLPQC